MNQNYASKQEFEAPVQLAIDSATQQIERDANLFGVMVEELESRLSRVVRSCPPTTNEKIGAAIAALHACDLSRQLLELSGQLGGSNARLRSLIDRLCL